MRHNFFDSEIVDLAALLANRGLRVIVAGLDTDFRGEPFGSMPVLMAQAEHVDKLQASLHGLRANSPAVRNAWSMENRRAMMTRSSS